MYKIHFITSKSNDAINTFNYLTGIYGQVDIGGANIIVAIGGDGTMLHALHANLDSNLPVYGVNRGSVGFLMNNFDEDTDDLYVKLNQAETVSIHPLEMLTVDIHGGEKESIAFNEVSLLRQSSQAAKICIKVNGVVRIDELICDGVLVATPAGSTAYNLSAHGPIIPLSSDILALTPISAFRPRRWRGALVPSNSHIEFTILDNESRPVAAAGDGFEIDFVKSVSVKQSNISRNIMFDQGHSLEERIIKEQFSW